MENCCGLWDFAITDETTVQKLVLVKENHSKITLTTRIYYTYHTSNESTHGHARNTMQAFFYFSQQGKIAPPISAVLPDGCHCHLTEVYHYRDAAAGNTVGKFE